MSNHEEIQRLLKASREMLQKNNSQLNEDISDIKKRYGMINEQKFTDNNADIETGAEITQRVNVPGSVESEIDFDEDKYVYVKKEYSYGIYEEFIRQISNTKNKRRKK